MYTLSHNQGLRVFCAMANVNLAAGFDQKPEIRVESLPNLHVAVCLN